MFTSLVLALALVGGAHPLRGRVVSAGSVIPGVIINVTAADGRPRYAITDAHGEFAFGVPLKNHCVRAELAGFEPVEASIFDVRAPMEIELGPPVKGAVTVTCVLPNYIVCRITSSADGSPLEGVELTLTIGDDSSTGFTDTHGQASAMVGWTDVRPYRLLARKRGYRSAEIRGVLPGAGFAIPIVLGAESRVRH